MMTAVTSYVADEKIDKISDVSVTVADISIDVNCDLSIIQEEGVIPDHDDVCSTEYNEEGESSARAAEDKNDVQRKWGGYITDDNSLFLTTGVDDDLTALIPFTVANGNYAADNDDANEDGNEGAAVEAVRDKDQHNKEGEILEQCVAPSSSHSVGDDRGSGDSDDSHRSVNPVEVTDIQTDVFNGEPKVAREDAVEIAAQSTVRKKTVNFNDEKDAGGREENIAIRENISGVKSCGKSRTFILDSDRVVDVDRSPQKSLKKSSVAGITGPDGGVTMRSSSCADGGGPLPITCSDYDAWNETDQALFIKVVP